jgi:hypothetical protein
MVGVLVLTLHVIFSFKTKACSVDKHTDDIGRHDTFCRCCTWELRHRRYVERGSFML